MLGMTRFQMESTLREKALIRLRNIGGELLRSDPQGKMTLLAHHRSCAKLQKFAARKPGEGEPGWVVWGHWRFLQRARFDYLSNT